MQEKFLVYNQNTVNYSHEIHCHEGKSPSTLNNVSTKACRSISASESDTYRKLGSPSITVSFVSFLQHRHNYRKYMKDDEEIKKGFQNWTVTEIWGQGRMEFRFNSLSPSDLGESLHFLGDSNCHFHPTAVTRNSSWGTPATASTPRFRTSLEHRFNSSCIIRLKRPSTPPALYISISTRTRVMDLDENRALPERHYQAGYYAAKKRKTQHLAHKYADTQWIGGSTESYLPFPFPNRQSLMGVPGMGYRGEEKKRGGKWLPLAAARLSDGEVVNHGGWGNTGSLLDRKSVV